MFVNEHTTVLQLHLDVVIFIFLLFFYVCVHSYAPIHTQIYLSLNQYIWKIDENRLAYIDWDKYETTKTDWLIWAQLEK